MSTYGHRGYGRNIRGRSFGPSNGNLRPSIDLNILDGLGPSPLKELQRPVTINCKGVGPRDVMPVSSYNWTNDEEPTIIVPGCPPIWQNIVTPFRLERDTGVSFIDQNRHRVPHHPLLPLVLAVDSHSPEFKLSEIDVVTDRNNLRKLLRWIDGSNKADFRIDLQLSGSTVLFTRYESIKVETDSARLGYGRNFEQCTTKRLAGCEKSTGHHRIISYDFGGLRLLVRFEVDACLYYNTETQSRIDSPSAQRPIPEDDPDDLTAALRRMSIRSDDKIEIIKKGKLVPQSTLVEVSTKSIQSLEKGIEWQEFFPQLFLSQTPHHYLGVHNRGQFQRIDARALNDSVLAAQKLEQQPSFDKLCALLTEIKDLVISYGAEKHVSLVYRLQNKKLEVFSRVSEDNALPDSWLRRFETSAQEDPVEDERATATAIDGPGRLDDSKNGVNDTSGEVDFEKASPGTQTLTDRCIA